MKRPRRSQVLSGILVVVALIAAIVLYGRGKEGRPEPSAPGYYTGPMKSKGDPTVYGTDEGVKVAPPPAAAKTPSAKGNPPKAKSDNL